MWYISLNFFVAFSGLYARTEVKSAMARIGRRSEREGGAWYAEVNVALDDKALDHFFSLTPERILSAVETLGLRCTGRYLALNSMENRVMEVEVEVDEASVHSPSDRFRVIKFYRPGRWSRQQIEEEHRFLLDLHAHEVPVVPPLQSSDGATLFECHDVPIFFAVFPKSRGRTPQEFSEEEMVRMGRLIARMHTVGSSRDAPHRLVLSPEVYGRQNLEYLLSLDVMTPEVKEMYRGLVERCLGIFASWFDGVAPQRIHGDLHLGNIIWHDSSPCLVDFDDMVMGPPVQDLWLIVPGRDEQGRRLQNALLRGYEEIRRFDRGTLRLIEPLRTLRYIHFTAWIARRWEDPSFKRVFQDFATPKYWREQLGDLQEQYELLQGAWA